MAFKRTVKIRFQTQQDHDTLVLYLKHFKLDLAGFANIAVQKEIEVLLKRIQELAEKKAKEMESNGEAIESPVNQGDIGDTQPSQSIDNPVLADQGTAVVENS